MPAYNFKKKFAKLVESGEKRQTIRKARKRPTVVGDPLYLYTGMRTKECRKLLETTCCRVIPIHICYDHIILQTEEKQAVVYYWDTVEAKKIVKDDGFENWGEFIDFFREAYELPFYGKLIFWSKPCYN